MSLALPGSLLPNTTHRLRDEQCVILPQRLRGSLSAVRAVQHTRVCPMETRVVAEVRELCVHLEAHGRTDNKPGSTSNHITAVQE
jgi:hypothetical protein